MIKATVEYLIATALVLGLSYAAMTFITGKISDSLNATAELIANPEMARDR